MAIDRKKTSSIIKIIAVAIYITYVFIYNSKLYIYLPLHTKQEHSRIEEISKQKKKLAHKSSYTLIGGSNVQMGLSGELISSDSTICMNFGIEGEYGGNSAYFNWLDGIVTTNIVVYSPIIIWNDGHNLIGENQNSKEKHFPIFSLANQVSHFFSPKKSPDSLIFNRFGDLTNYSNNKPFDDFKIKTQSFTSSNDIISKEISRRVNKLKEITNAKKVLIRVPPIYISDVNKELYINTMRKRIDIIKSFGITVIEIPFVHTDKTLFWDNLHPSQKGRAIFSKELKDALHYIKTIH
jgi:hypothetical protein